MELTEAHRAKLWEVLHASNRAYAATADVAAVVDRDAADAIRNELNRQRTTLHELLKETDK